MMVDVGNTVPEPGSSMVSSGIEGGGLRSSVVGGVYMRADCHLEESASWSGGPRYHGLLMNLI